MEYDELMPRVDTELELTEVEKQEIRALVLESKENVENAYWEFANAILPVWKQSLFLEWGFVSFDEYVDAELQYSRRTVRYLTNIVEYFGKMSPEIQEWVRDIGWSKAKELVNRVTEENFSEWKEKISGKSVTSLIKLLKDGDSSSESEEIGEDEEPKEKPKRMGFSFYDEQREVVREAIDRCKVEAQTDVDSHALTLICQDFLNQGATDLSSRLKAIEHTFGVKIVSFKVVEDEELRLMYGEENMSFFEDDETESVEE